MKKYILNFLSFVLCLLLTSCSSNNSEYTDNIQDTFENSHALPLFFLSWNSFEEIAELKGAFERKDEKAFYDYLLDEEHFYMGNGLNSKETAKKLLDQFSQMTTLSLSESCKLKLAWINYYWDSSSLKISYQKGSGSTFEQCIEFAIYSAEDSAFAEASNRLSELTAIDSININSNQIDLYAIGSYESKYGTVMCSKGCFETDNSYIVINYRTINESAALDPCIKEHLQMTSLNELIGEYSYVETSRKIRWSSFEEIAELKEAFVEYGDADFYDYFKENTQSDNFEEDFNGVTAIEDFFEKINQKTAVLLDKGCRFKLAEIVYDYDADSLTISYQEEGEADFKRRIEFTTFFTDDSFKRYSDFLSECNQIDSVNLEAQKIDLYATGSYENKSHTVICSRGCFEKDNYYIAINYNTVNENAVLDPCIKEHLQLTNLNELIG